MNGGILSTETRLPLAGEKLIPDQPGVLLFQSGPTAGVEVMAKKKPVPAMYPKPEVRIEEPQKIIAVDLKTKTITLAGSPPPELLAASEIERQRLDLNSRLKSYAQSCLLQIMPHFGERPKNIPAAKWNNLEQRVRLISKLPESAPAEAHDALRALQTLNYLVAELVNAGDYPDAIDRAICWAIDLGQLLQRRQTQIDYGEAVDVGRRNVRSRANANSAKSEAAQQRFKLAESEYHRRMKDGSKKTATLKSMSKVKDHNGKPVYGSFGQLKRDVKSFKSLTPAE